MRTIVTLLAIFSASAAFLAAVGPQSAQPVRHVVVFKYESGATPGQIQQVTDEFRALKSRIPGITGFEHGLHPSPEGEKLGFTHVFPADVRRCAKRAKAFLPAPGLCNSVNF